MKQYTVTEAAKLLGVTIQAVYQAIRRKALQAKKRDGVLYTTDDWIGHYLQNLHSKQLHACYNGAKTFSEKNGEYSAKYVAKKFGMTEFQVYFNIRQGKIRAYKKGMYWIIPIEEMENVAQVAEELRKIAWHAITHTAISYKKD